MAKSFLGKLTTFHPEYPNNPQLIVRMLPNIRMFYPQIGRMLHNTTQKIYSKKERKERNIVVAHVAKQKRKLYAFS
jgi:hypothetical protein